MLFCKLNILKQDENGNWYKPKNSIGSAAFSLRTSFTVSYG